MVHETLDDHVFDVSSSTLDIADMETRCFTLSWPSPLSLRGWALDASPFSLRVPAGYSEVPKLSVHVTCLHCHPGKADILEGPVL